MESRLVPWLACAAIAAVLLWVALWSGGGDSTPATGGTAAGAGASVAPAAGQAELEQMLSRTFTQNDPKQCTQDMTRAFLRHSFGSTAGTLDRCRRTNTPQSDTSAQNIAVESVRVTGSSAVAVVRASGGRSDGTVSTFRVAREGGQWKLDQLVDIRIDRARLDQTLRNDLGRRGYLPAETECAMAKYDQAVSDQDIERSAIVGDPSSVGVEQYAASCLSRSTLLRQLGEVVTASLATRGISGPVARCVVDRITHGVPTARLRRLLAAGERGADGWARLGYEAALACMGNRSGGSSSTSAA